jgi:hypothetical protein
VAFDPVPLDERVSWCVASQDVDGLRVKLHGFGAASLVRKQLEWWAEGFAFPNTAWRDDLRDLGSVLCPIAGERVLGWAEYAGGAAADLCAKMAAGAYAANPALALRHPLFAGSPAPPPGGSSLSGAAAVSSAYLGLPPLDALQRPQRALYVYTPVTIGTAPIAGPSPSPQPAGPGAGPTPSPSSPARYPEAAEVPRQVVLRLVTPRRPWLVHRDSLSASVAWAEHQVPAWVAKLAPQTSATTYNVFVNGVSVFSGTQLTYHLDLPTPAQQRACQRVQVAAFYPSLGWTERSEPLEINDCSRTPVEPRLGA